MFRKKLFVLKQPFMFLFSWRPFPWYELISYVAMYASVPMLAYGIHIYSWEVIRTIVFTILTLYSGFFAALIWNDITDADVDAVVHPNRPVPRGRISPRKFFTVALVFSAMTFVFAVFISLWCLLLVGVAALFVTFHNKYLKRVVGIPAYSEIFTPLQWVVVPIFGYLAVFSNPMFLSQKNYVQLNAPFLGPLWVNSLSLSNMILLAIFTYFTDNAHDLPEGIHDVDGDRKLGIKTYATSFGEKNAAKISFMMFIISGVLGIILFMKTILSLVFLIPFIIIWTYTIHSSYLLIKTDMENIKDMGKIMGRKGFDYFLMSYSLIFIDISLQLINHHFHII
ncbi:MAG: hypothetical protein DRN08_04020 [Thermoplasmata archaeon]|nr:MAG: hypothetical protein DRN08_04020 [Thermoplasmata archaeon]